MTRKSKGRGTADLYLDEYKLWPDTQFSAEALGILCGAPRFNLRVDPQNGTLLYRFEVVGPREMLVRLNELWGTAYHSQLYSGNLYSLASTSALVLEGLLRVGFQPGDTEETLDLDAIRSHVPEEVQAYFHQGYQFSLNFRINDEKWGKTAIQVSPSSWSLRLQHLEPDTPPKAFAMGFLAWVPRAWFRAGKYELNLAGPEAYLKKLSELWGVNYLLRAATGSQVYITIRSQEVCAYLAKIGIATLAGNARVADWRRLMPDNMQNDFDRGVTEAQQILDEAERASLTKKETVTASKPHDFTKHPRGRLHLASLLPTKPISALAWGILSALETKLYTEGHPTHFYLHLQGLARVLELLQQLWQIDPPYPIQQQRQTLIYHFRISSKECFLYLEAIQESGTLTAERMRSFVPDELRVFFDTGRKLGQGFT